MYTITILMYLTLITMVGAYYMQKAAFRYLTRYVEKNSTPATPAPMVGLDYRMFPALVDLMETYTSPWDLDDSFPMGGADMDDHFVLDLHWKEIPCVWSSSSEKYDAWNAEYDRIYAQQLNDSINAYEAEMDREWEDEIQGYMFCDIATMMALTTEDLYERYEDLPFTASMIRSAKPGNRGIVVMDNSDYERSVGTHNHKDHNHR